MPRADEWMSAYRLEEAKENCKDKERVYNPVGENIPGQ